MAQPNEDAYDANGVDRTLVRKMLELTPAERAQSHDRLLAEVEQLAAAGKLLAARSRQCGS